MIIASQAVTLNDYNNEHDDEDCAKRSGRGLGSLCSTRELIRESQLLCVGFDFVLMAAKSIKTESGKQFCQIILY